MKKEKHTSKEKALAKKKAAPTVTEEGKKLKHGAKAEAKEGKKPKPSTKEGKAGIPTGGFKTGAVAAIPFKMKLTGNIVNYIVTKAGVALLQVVKSSDPDKQAFMKNFWAALESSPTMQRELRSLGIYKIRAGLASNAARSFIYGDNKEVFDQQLALMTGEGATKGAIEQLVKKAVHYIDKITSTTSDQQKYSTRTHLGDDLTPRSGPVALDCLLLDIDVIQMIKAAYPTVKLSKIAKHQQIMCNFFTDVEHGKDVIKNHLKPKPNPYEQDMMVKAEEQEEEEISDDEGEYAEGTEEAEEVEDDSSDGEAEYKPDGSGTEEEDESQSGSDEDSSSTVSDSRRETD